MKKLVLLILVTVALYGCNGYLDKSVFEPLTVKELKKAIDRDTLFEEVYRVIQFRKDSVFTSDIEKAKFADLTYRRVLKLANFARDTNRLNTLTEKWTEEWQQKYGYLHAKADSVSDYWERYRDEHSLNQYVTIEPVSINKEYYTYAGGIKNVQLGFRLTPLKGPVQQIKFGYRIEAKIEEKDKDDENASLYSVLGMNWCLSTAPFSQPVVRYWEAGYRNEDLLADRTIETLLRDYNIIIEIDQLRKDGENMNTGEEQIPESIKDYWRTRDKEYLKDMYIGDVLKEILGIEYMPLYEYKFRERNKTLQEKDELAFRFLIGSEEDN